MKLSNKYKIIHLVQIANVSKSWYYSYLKRYYINDLDLEDYRVIRKLVIKYNYTYWYRMITMLLRSEKNIIMNHKKVLSIMRKYKLLSKVRRKNPYKHMLKATSEHSVVKNILNRCFKWNMPYKKLW